MVVEGRLCCREGGGGCRAFGGRLRDTNHKDEYNRNGYRPD